jgi:Flp pilus assembly protein TadD
VNTLCNLADLLSKEPGGRGEAEVLFRRALVLEPGHVNTLNVLGYLLSKDPERLAEAGELLRRALVIQPEYCWALGNLAVVLAARGDAGALEEAMQLCKRARTALAGGTLASRAHVAAALGIVLLRSGDAAAAREKLDEARELDTHSEVAADLGLLLELGRQ